MKQFSNKAGVLMLAASIAALAAGEAVVLCAPWILERLPVFLEERVFHRTFDHEAYFSSMVSLISYPAFFVIVIDALIFLKFSDAHKEILLAFCIASVFFITAFLTYRFCGNYMYSDDPSEYLLGRECYLQKSFFPRTWYYSTEIRILNMQLVSGPLFFFTKNLVLIRTVTVTVFLAVLFLSAFFLLSVLKIEKLWIKLLCCLLLISPASQNWWDFFHFGTFYIVHVAICFFYVGLFILLAFENLSQRKRLVLAAVFFFLAFCGGLGSIRYILNFILPVVFVTAGRNLIVQCKEENSISLRILKRDRESFYALMGLLTAVVGYAVNTFVLASLYSFKNYNKVRFLPLGEATVTGVIDMILSVAGYNENVSVFAPGGFATVLLGVVIVAVLALFVMKCRMELSGKDRLFMHFVAASVLFQLYTNICTEMVPRFLIMTLCYFAPVLALLLSEKRIHGLHRFVLGASAAVFILTNAFGIWTKFQVKDETKEMKKACAFLVENGYSFGYSFFSCANPMWFLSNGALEVADLNHGDAEDGTDTMLSSYSPHRWLTVKRYYEDGYAEGKRVFLLLPEEDAKNTPEHSVFKNGRKIYDEDGYVIFDYESNDAFKAAFY